jgi:hypothetical protein
VGELLSALLLVRFECARILLQPEFQYPRRRVEIAEQTHTAEGRKKILKPPATPKESAHQLFKFQ